MTQDFATYDKKCATYLDACATAAENASKDDENANENASVTVHIGDPRDFWVKQVILS